MSETDIALYVSAAVVLINTLASVIAAYQSRSNNAKIELARINAEIAHKQLSAKVDETTAKVEEVSEKLP